MRALLLFLRRRIALKLTLTLVGFTAIAGLAAALYLRFRSGAWRRFELTDGLPQA